MIPPIGKKVVGDAEPYEYLVNSIKHFYNQEELKNKLIDNNFFNVEYRNLAYGVASIHTGWKVE